MTDKLVNGSTWHLRADVSGEAASIDGVRSFDGATKQLARCSLCSETTTFPVGGDWSFPWLHGRVWRLCPSCSSRDFAADMLAIVTAESASRPEKGRRRR